MKNVICTKRGKFTIAGEDISLKVGDPVPAVLCDAALSQGWGELAPAKKKPVEK